MDQQDTTDCKSSDEREVRYHQFVALIARHDVAIRRFIRYLLPSGEGVDDVMQDTALECWRKYDDFSPAASERESEDFIRWACVIARFKALSWQRDRSRDRLVFRESVIAQLAATAMGELDQQEFERKAMEHCLQRLNQDQRRLVLSVHTPGQSIAGIAAETGQKARKLYSRINSLRRILMICIERQTAEGP